MRAVVLKQFGSPSNLCLEEIKTPKPSPGQVLVRINASGVNPIDCKIRTMKLPFAPELPAILGMDLAGTVMETASDITQFMPGDEVWGCVGGLGSLQGTMAEYIVVDAELLAKKPSALSPRQAAALPLVSITASMALFDRIRLQPNTHILVHGGAGGVGHVAIQLAKATGARVAATVSTPQKAELAQQLGADDIIMYREEAVPEYVERLTAGAGFQAVFDTVGGSNLDASILATGNEATVVSTNTRSTHDLSLVHAKGLTLSVVFMLLPLITGTQRTKYTAVLDAMHSLADDGRLRPLVDSTRYRLEQAAEAHARVENGEATGKVVIDVH